MRTQVIFALTAILAFATIARGADSGAPAAGTAAASSPRVAVLTGEQVVQILDETVDWYRTLGIQQQNATQPSDLLILFANRQTADKVVALAFDIARANAELISSEAGSAQNSADASAARALAQKQDQLLAQRQSIEQEMSAARQKRAGAKLTELQGELSLVDARKNLLDTMTEFVDTSDAKTAAASALKAQINAIAAAVPGSGNGTAAASSTTAVPVASAGATTAASNDGRAASASPERYGIWQLGTNVLTQRNKIATIDLVDQHTAALAKTFKTISTLPLKQLQALSARSDVLAAQANSAGSPALKDLRNEFDTLAWLFKQTSEILLPLTKEQVLLQQYRHNLENWRDSAQRQYHDAVTAFAVRFGILIGILAIVFVLGEVWRRAVLRYAHEPRRRYQLLLVRTIVLWTVVLAILGLSFVTEISTFATFAGLLTAGVAVAMQSVLVSIVGYFFLIGKYGIRVGDRIQIGTVVGEVIDIGLVRMHLMELNQQGPLGPTGRVVAFANLIVFQAAGGLFKQIPGVNLAWHETTLTLPVVSDYAALKEKLLAAICAVLSDYRDEIVRQTNEIVKSTATGSQTDTTPQVQMHLADGHMVALIRYPVHLDHAAEIDERVAQAVMHTLTENS
jgi:small-conductance mechanosensitive channel